MRERVPLDDDPFQTANLHVEDNHTKRTEDAGIQGQVIGILRKTPLNPTHSSDPGRDLTTEYQVVLG